MPTLLDYQRTVREFRRSIRRYIPMIAQRTGYTCGIVTCYMDGHGSCVNKYKSIVAAIHQVIKEKADQIDALEIESKRQKLEGKPRKKYTKRGM